MERGKKQVKAKATSNVKDVVRARAFRMGFLGSGDGMHRVRPDHVVNVSREFFEGNKHWLREDEDKVLPQDKRSFDKRPMKMDVI